MATAISFFILGYSAEKENEIEYGPYMVHWVEYKADNWELELSESEYDVVCYIISGEVGNLSLDSKLAVASCLYNACKLESKMPSEIRIEYKYAGWKENLEFESPKDWEEIEFAIERVFKHGEVISEDVLYFYNPKICNSKWHESMMYIMTIDGQRYFGLNK